MAVADAQKGLGVPTLRDAVLDQLDSQRSALLSAALRKALISPSLKFCSDSGRARLAAFAQNMPEGVEGVECAADLLTELSFEPVADASVRSFIVYREPSDKFWHAVSDTLRREGLVVIPNYLSQHQTRELNDAVAEAEAIYASHLWKNENIVGEGFYYRGDPTTALMRTAKEFAAYPGAVVVARDGDHDRGIIDTFNFDALTQRLKDAGDAIMRPPEMIEAITRAFGQPFRPRNLNYYLNDNTGRPGYVTRDFHIDSAVTVKNFLYLTDVPDTSFGPYAFIPRSHRMTVLHEVNRLVAADMGWFSLDTKIVNRSGATPCCAPAGAMIISNQLGLHRGMTQETGRRRALLTHAFNCDRPQT